MPRFLAVFPAASTRNAAGVGGFGHRGGAGAMASRITQLPWVTVRERDGIPSNNSREASWAATENPGPPSELHALPFPLQNHNRGVF